MFSIKISLILTALLLVITFNSAALDSAAIVDEYTNIEAKIFIIAADIDDTFDIAHAPHELFKLKAIRFLFSLTLSSHKFINNFNNLYAIRAPPLVAFS